jgi:1-acyl-sn-glycerol-3-phosphate acyltransferase
MTPIESSSCLQNMTFLKWPQLVIFAALNSTPFTSLIDVFLFTLNIFNLLVFIVIMIPGYAPYKKSFVKNQLWIAQRSIEVPNLVIFTNLTLAALAIHLFVLANDGDTVALIRAIVSVYTLFLTLLVQKVVKVVLVLGDDRVLEYESEVDRIDTIINFKPLPKALMATLVAPLEAILRSECTGIDNVPTEEPALYVMNHSLYGIEMAPFVNTVYQQKGIYLRGLGDHFHFASPHAEIMRAVGAVDGTRENLDCLMENKHNVLVYPGGSHEILKHSSVPKYSLMWKERLGFAKKAIEHGYPIMPCAAVGIEEMFDVIGDLPVSGLLGKGVTIPISLPVSPYRLQKVYFWFGEPIPTAHYKGDWKNEDFAREVRDKTKAAIEIGIEQLKQKQQSDPNRFLIHEYANKLLGTGRTDEMPQQLQSMTEKKTK